MLYSPLPPDSSLLSKLPRSHFGVLSLPNAFSSLTRLDLSSLPIPASSLAHLRDVPLERLNLNATRTNLAGVAHLVVFRPTLRVLHLARNPDVGDAALPLLNLLARITSIDLDGTAVSVVGIRKLILVATETQDDLVRISPPEDVRTWLVRPYSFLRFTSITSRCSYASS